MSETVTIEVAAQLSSVRLLCAGVRAIVTESELGAAGAAQAELALGEAATNVVRHAMKDRPDGQMRLEVEISKESIEFVLSDPGNPFDPELIAATRGPLFDDDAPLDDLPEGGMGIFLIQQIMDHVELERAGERNVLTMRLGRPPEENDTSESESTEAHLQADVS